MATYQMNKCTKDKELFWYHDGSKNKLFAYRHRYYDSFGRRKEKSARGFTNENAAFRELLRIKTEVAAGNTRLIENDNLTIKQWAEKWLEANEGNWKVTTNKQRKDIVEQQIIPMLGNQKLMKLDKEAYITLYIKPLSKKYSVGTVKLYHRIFKVMINGAVDAEIITRNRFTKVKIANDIEPTDVI